MWEMGPHTVKTMKVSKVADICCGLLVAIPEDAGRYPVVQFQHGTLLKNSDYSSLLIQVASWGFIVVAPQMYSFLELDPTTEIKHARTILNWMKAGLLPSLPPAYASHQPDFDKVVLAGHSRGGLVVFGVALNYKTTLTQSYSAIVGVDPVDLGWPMGPYILKHQENSLDVGVPTLILGTGLGEVFPACAPEYQGHKNFYRDLMPPSFHFAVSSYGHMDFCDDCRWWDFNMRCKSPCWSGTGKKQLMREFTAGLMVAFFQDVLLHNNATLSAEMAQPRLAPALADTIESKGNITYLS